MSQAPTAKLALERATQSKARVRIFYGDPETGKDDCNETERVGKVRKTKSGTYVLVSCIHKTSTRRNWIHVIELERVVRVARYTSGACKPVELYRHPSYFPGNWSSYHRSDIGRWIAIRNGLIHATFDNEIDAALYVDYIVGNRVRNFYNNKAISFKTLLKRIHKP